MDPSNYPNWSDWNMAVQRVDALTALNASIGFAVLLIFVFARSRSSKLLSLLRAVGPILFYAALFFVVLGKLWKLW